MQASGMSRKPYDWSEAARALRDLFRDPTEPTSALRVINALPGHAWERVAQRLRSTPNGARMLREQPSIVPVLCDRARLEAMPADSLGAAYLRFMDEENLSAEGLLAATEAAGNKHKLTEEVDFVWEYNRDTHDLWHVVTGYKGDLLGEPALQAFGFAQTWCPGVGFIATLVFLNGWVIDGMRSIVLEGFLRGLRSAWFPEEDWEVLLPLPLEEVRRRLRVPAQKPYEPVRAIPTRREVREARRRRRIAEGAGPSPFSRIEEAMSDLEEALARRLGLERPPEAESRGGQGASPAQSSFS